jgi:hypothetical protein
MSRYRRVEEEPHNRRLWLTLHDLPFPNDVPSILQLSTNVGIAIRDGKNSLPETCCLVYVFYCSVQAPVALCQSRQEQIPYAHAAQFPLNEAVAQQVPPDGLSVEEGAQALAGIPNLWHVQEATQLTAVSTIVGHAHDSSHLAGIFAQPIQECGLPSAIPQRDDVHRAPTVCCRRMGGSGENAERFILPQLTVQGEGQLV